MTGGFHIINEHFGGDRGVPPLNWTQRVGVCEDTCNDRHVEVTYTPTI